MTAQTDRIEPGQAWTGRSGMGPDLVIEKVDLDKGLVHARRVPTDLEHPTFVTDLNSFCAHFLLGAAFSRPRSR